eukprot:SAG25_NODE_486_length_7469_cov_4.137449_6_plen_89_part_00
MYTGTACIAITKYVDVSRGGGIDGSHHGRRPKPMIEFNDMPIVKSPHSGCNSLFRKFRDLSITDPIVVWLYTIPCEYPGPVTNRHETD